MSDEATLYVCGRDVDEPAEHCLSWDRARARWSLTRGDPRVSRLPAEQRRVYELLSEAPKSMKDLTALNLGHVVTDLRKILERKQSTAFAKFVIATFLNAREYRSVQVLPNNFINGMSVYCFPVSA